MLDERGSQLQPLNRGSLVDWDVISDTGTYVHLAGSPDLYATFLEHHLSPVGKPTHDSRNYEEDREEVEREPW